MSVYALALQLRRLGFGATLAARQCRAFAEVAQCGGSPHGESALSEDVDLDS